MLEMSAMCHDRRVTCVMIEEFHTSQLMDVMRLRLFGVREFLNAKSRYLLRGRNREVISQCLSLINP
jgi:hypothetical protein